MYIYLQPPKPSFFRVLKKNIGYFKKPGFPISWNIPKAIGMNKEGNGANM
jgi:hypothetical protein